MHYDDSVPCCLTAVAYGLQPAYHRRVRQTPEFATWLHRLKDANAVARIRRMEMGNPGDAGGEM
jgi:hypothetical protein